MIESVMLTEKKNIEKEYKQKKTESNEKDGTVQNCRMKNFVLFCFVSYRFIPFVLHFSFHLNSTSSDFTYIFC